MSQDFLLELGCEDLPARYVLPLASALKDGITGGLTKRGVQIGAAKMFATPRRIAVSVESVADKQADQKIERHGPALAAALKDGQPTQAALGFAKSCGVEFSAVAQKDGKLYFAKSEPGRNTAELIAEIFEETLKSMDALVPKRMKWGSGEETFVRPVQWITCLLGAKVVALQRFGLKASNETFGHRFHAPQAIALQSPADYEARLKAAKVWADFESRRLEIKKQIEAEAKKLKGTARITDDLLTEVAALVEWPTAIHGRMEERFMALPPEVVIATIETNQRYFPVFGADKKLLPVFITVSNIESKDFTQVVTGNERVVRPRLTDALFFWEQDRKKPLADYAAALDKVTFQKDLGSTGDKVRRITKLAVHIASQLGEDKAVVERAAMLCKADLTTRMVFEFPELQGIMGGYYAEASGESKTVAQAIREHYLPNQSGGPIPSTRTGQIVALADKLDSLAGIFAIGQKPTASKDPFALRRAALGVLRICIESELSLDLQEVLKMALDVQRTGKRDAVLLNELIEFIFERFVAWMNMPSTFQPLLEMQAANSASNIFGLKLPEGAVFSSNIFAALRSTRSSNPANYFMRYRTLYLNQSQDWLRNLAGANKRIANILKQAGDPGAVNVNATLLEHAAEKSLAAKMVELEKANAKADYATKLKNLATLREPVDAFFEGVMVNAENVALRNNRLALLRQLDRLCRDVADLSQLPG